MARRRWAILLLLPTLALAFPALAAAHGLAGQRFFPATLAVDDPFVADELSFVTVSHIKLRGSEEGPPTRETSFGAEFSKRLTPDFGVSLGGTLKVLDPDEGRTVSGFDNLEVALKYVFFKSDPHETILALGLAWDVGGTGRAKVGAESFDTVTPQLFFGKGMGDLPEAVRYLKPFAVTGVVGLAVPTREHNKHYVLDDDGNVEIEREPNPNVLQWGLTLQYSLQYLQSYVQDIGLPRPFSRMIPIIEFAMETPTQGRQAGRTTGTINPGIIWFGRYFQIAVEAVIPVNERSGKNVGVIGQLHFYLDDIWPKIFTWTPFHGVLGPTQPQ
jgi:hypothetical protein